MTSGADLFVVCKQCGSEVSPYITECPYCGHRLRRRAPKLPRERARAGLRARPPACDACWCPPRCAGARVRAAAASRAGRRVVRPARTRRSRSSRRAAACTWPACATVAPDLKLAIVGPLHGDWWKLFTSQFAYGSGLLRVHRTGRHRDLRLAAGAAPRAARRAGAGPRGGRRRCAGGDRRLPGAVANGGERRGARPARRLGGAGHKGGARGRLLRGRPARRRRARGAAAGDPLRAPRSVYWTFSRRGARHGWASPESPGGGGSGTGPRLRPPGRETERSRRPMIGAR